MIFFGRTLWKELGKGFLMVFNRFPLAVLSAVVCAVAVSVLVDLDVSEHVVAYSHLTKLAFASGLGISTFILTSLIAENVGGKFSIWGILVSAAGLLFLTVFGWLIPIDDQGRILGVFWMRLFTLGGIFHLGIAVCPYLRPTKADSALWEYNKLLLIRFLLSAFSSAVFFVGAALALVSIDKLFGAEIDEENYARIWFFCAFVLTTCLLLAGIPEKEDRPQLVVDYPKWIHFFCKFILLPLVVLYFGILYAYAIKIVVTWSWPDGMVGMPVFILAAIGGLTGLLIWPLTRLEPVSKWAESFWRLYFPLIIPLAILLLLALQRRIGDYGFTEIRYLGLILACWLLAIAAFYTAKPGSSFRVIPWSLFGLLILCFWGPLSPGGVAFKSQWKRLNSLLMQEGLLVDGALTPNPHQVDDSVFQDLKSIIRYLYGSYGGKPFVPLIEGVDPSVRTDSEGQDWLEESSYGFARAFMDYTGLVSDEGRGDGYYEVRFDPTMPIPIRDSYDLFVVHPFSSSDQALKEFSVGGTIVHLEGESDSSSILFRSSTGEELARLDFLPWIEDHDLSNLPMKERMDQFLDPADLFFEVDLGDLGTVKIMTKYLRIRQQDEDWSLKSGEFWVLVPAE